MERATAEEIENWVQQTFGDRQRITKEELVNIADNSNLPQDMKDAIEGLPDGEWSKYDLVGVVRRSAGAEVE